MSHIEETEGSSRDPTTTTDIAKARLEAQADLEDRSLALGEHRFERKLEEAKAKGRASTYGGAKKLLSSGYEPLVEAIEWWLEEKDGRNANRKWIDRVGPEKAATITLKVVLDGIYNPRAFTTVVRSISDRILMELRAERLKEEAPGLFKYRMRSFTGTAHYRHMKNSMNATIRYSEVDTSDLELSDTRRVTLGTVLVDLFQQATGLVEIRNVREGRKTTKIIEASESTLSWLGSRNDALRGLYPMYAPMVVPPLAWEPGERGGYRFALRGRQTLVRRGKLDHPTRDDLHEVYSALNHVQESSWVINLRVLEVLEEVVDRNGGRAGIPELEQIPMPPKPHDIDTNEEAKRAWKEQARRRHLRERERKSDASEFLKTLDLSSDLRDAEELYFPANLGWRGRVYYVPETLTPQGPDLHRGLLMWAEGKRLGRDGAMWLAIHGANVIGDYGRPGLDKAPLQERVDWVVANSEEITSWADAPMVSTGWQDCDDPWQALAFAFEWARFLKHRGRGRSDESFMSFLPVSVDGSCNGLQHWSALTRDEEGARAVNLLPMDEVQDFYTEVREATLDALEEVAASGHQPDAKLASLWLQSGQVDRDMVKRPAMTFFYGSKKYGFSNQLHEEISSRGLEFELQDHFTLMIDGEEESLYRNSLNILASAIWDAIGASASGAHAAMEWVQDAVRECSKSSGGRVSWTVPKTGFEVVQHYSKDTAKRVNTYLSGQLIQPTIYVKEEDAEPDTRRQGSAAPPNFIHSLDAANLVMAVNAAASEGVSHIGVIHDSFFTHAGDMTLLSRCIRQTFFELHRDAVLEDFEAQLRAQAEHPDDIPEPPRMGSLDLSGVLRSYYFFS